MHLRAGRVQRHLPGHVHGRPGPWLRLPGRQRLLRRSVQAVPTISDASRLEVSPDEVKAAIVLFFSLLDERQRRLYAGLESLKLGRGGDTILADFLRLDPHTVARGRQQLLEQDVETGRVRKPGGGRKRVEKKRPR